MGFKLQRAACIWFGSVSSSDKQYFLNDTHENKANSYFFFSLTKMKNNTLKIQCCCEDEGQK